jgi:hypothetical protein
LPAANIAAAGATTFCEGGSVVLQANTGVGLTYQWLNGTTAIAGASSASHTANQTGSYSVVVTNANGCSATSAATAVTVNTLPAANIAAAGATTFCEGGSVVLQANTGVGLTYQWLNGTTAIAGANSASYTANQTGSYSVVVTNANGCSATSAATAVTVNTLPAANIAAAGATTFCEGGSVVLQANTGVGLTYQWLNGTTAIAGASSASYTANQTGSYSVVVTNANGCSATSTATAVTVNTLPTIHVSSPDGLRLNPATQVLLQANSSGSLITWYKDGNIVGSGASLMVTSNGNYKAIATQQECSAESEVMAVTSNVSPTISFTTDAAEYTAIATILMSADASDSDGSIAIVEFYLDGIKVGETSIQPYSFELPNMSAGTYQLKAIAIDQEGAKSESTVVQVVVKDPIQTSVLEETMRTIELFPNPFRETSRIRLDGNGTYELFTIDNHLMESGQVNQEVEIGSALSSGVYLLKVRVGDQFKTYKLIKQ